MISDGQPVNAAASNASWISRTQNSNTVGVVSLDNAGSTNIVSIQGVTNSVMSDIGRAGEVDATSKNYSSNNVVVNGDDRKVAIGRLDGSFDEIIGHNHNGANGSGGPVSASNLININKFFAEFQSVNFNAALGLDDIVTTEFTGLLPSGSNSQAGVVTVAPNNLVHIVNTSTLTFIEDAGGQRRSDRHRRDHGVVRPDP